LLRNGIGNGKAALPHCLLPQVEPGTGAASGGTRHRWNQAQVLPRCLLPQVEPGTGSSSILQQQMQACTTRAMQLHAHSRAYLRPLSHTQQRNQTLNESQSIIVVHASDS